MTPATMTTPSPDPKIIDGKSIAAEIREEVKQDAEKLRTASGITPCLATVIIGDRPDSATYVRMKIQACEACGLSSVHRSLPATASEAEVVECVQSLNDDKNVHGILVQLPLPSHVSEARVLSSVSIEKDVDGFHALNIGNLALRGRDEPWAIPCTPRGCIELLRRSNVTMNGARAVVIGRSNIVGMPVALLLMHENATVTIVHSRTKNSEEIVKQADIVIAAAGKTEMVKGSWLKPGCVVLDVGMNTKPDASKKRGYRLVGDVDFDECKQVASLITPVPGGVGPMTIAMVIRNCTDAAMRISKNDSI